MAKTSGLGDLFAVGGYDLSGDVSTLSKISTPLAVADVTAIKSSAMERLPLHKDGQIDFVTFMESTSAVSSPGVPGSTTPYTSTYNFSVLVTVTGGTGTQVAINGVNQGSFDGTYVLPALGTITLTYTLAPTWSWVAVKTSHDILSTLPTVDVVCTYMRGSTLGNPGAGMVAKQINYDPTRSAAGDLTLAVSEMSNGIGLEWGQQITAGYRTDTTATTGTAYDLGGSGTTFGCEAYLQLVGLVGTSVDVSITHSTTSGGVYTTLLDFGAQTGIGGFRQATSNTTTVNEFLKVVTTGTFTYAKFNIVFLLNQKAGYVT